MRKFLITIFILFIISCASSIATNDYWGDKVDLKQNVYQLIDVIPIDDNSMYLVGEAASSRLMSSVEYDIALNEDWEKFLKKNGYVGYVVLDVFVEKDYSGANWAENDWLTKVTHKIVTARSKEELKQLQQFHR